MGRGRAGACGNTGRSNPSSDGFPTAPHRSGSIDAFGRFRIQVRTDARILRCRFTTGADVRARRSSHWRWRSSRGGRLDPGARRSGTAGSAWPSSAREPASSCSGSPPSSSSTRIRCSASPSAGSRPATSPPSNAIRSRRGFLPGGQMFMTARQVAPGLTDEREPHVVFGDGAGIGRDRHHRLASGFRLHRGSPRGASGPKPSPWYPFHVLLSAHDRLSSRFP